MSNVVKALGVVAFVIFVILALIFGPLLTIWCLNTLFPTLAIQYTWQTGLASLLLGAGFFGKYSK